MTTNTVLHQFLYRGWNVSIRLERTAAEGPIAGRADLRLGAGRSHRIVVDESYHDGGSALRHVAQRARGMVDEWQADAQRDVRGLQPLPSYGAAPMAH
jgi:hypothetical protein